MTSSVIVSWFSNIAYRVYLPSRSIWLLRDFLLRTIFSRATIKAQKIENYAARARDISAVNDTVAYIHVDARTYTCVYRPHYIYGT